MKHLLHLSIFIVFISCIKHGPKGKSRSVGSVSNGKLINGAKFNRKGSNYKYFSLASYYLFNRAWVHSKVKKTTLETYRIMTKKCPNRKFMIMECSRKNGGKMWPHRTHQNGTSIDFATPLLKNGKVFHGDFRRGVFHYAMKFDEKGQFGKKKKIDFETLGIHLLTLDSVARTNGLYIKKVLMKINLKDDFYKSKSGGKVKQKGIYFAQYLTPMIDNMHDDHYHVDFAFLQ